MGIQITVKDVDEKTFHELKSYAIQNKMTVGRAMTLAMHTLVMRRHRSRGKLLQVKPFDGGPGTEHLSERVDEVLYS